MPTSLKSYCSRTYKRTYATEYKLSLGKKTSKTAKEEAEKNAQKLAIKRTFELALIKYPNVEPYEIWDEIYIAYVLRKSKIKSTTINADLIQNIVASHQSWVKSSGHAFEAYIEEQANPEFSKNNTNIRFILQKELSASLKDQKIHNSKNDCIWLKKQCNKDVFDLFAIYTVNGDDYVFGCIQSKTSIRDRVSRDREPSQGAMKKGFWSIAVTLNGSFLTLPKFQEMVNGGGDTYKENGWHGMYVMYDNCVCDRIYSIQHDFSCLTDHAVLAAHEWISNRKEIKVDWKVD